MDTLNDKVWRQMQKIDLARAGEARAVHYLIDEGYLILERNYFASKHGELDIIALSPQNIICFIEVKTRNYRDTVSAFEHTGQMSMTPGKIKRIKKSALYYLNSPAYAERLAQLGLASHLSTRFDLILIKPDNKDQSILAVECHCLDYIFAF